MGKLYKEDEHQYLQRRNARHNADYRETCNDDLDTCRNCRHFQEEYDRYKDGSYCSELDSYVDSDCVCNEFDECYD